MPKKLSPGDIIVALVGDNPKAITLCVAVVCKKGEVITQLAELLTAKQAGKINNDMCAAIIKAALECEGIPLKLEEALKKLLPS